MNSCPHCGTPLSTTVVHDVESCRLTSRYPQTVSSMPQRVSALDDLKKLAPEIMHNGHWPENEAGYCPDCPRCKVDALIPRLEAEQAWLSKKLTEERNRAESDRTKYLQQCEELEISNPEISAMSKVFADRACGRLDAVDAMRTALAEGAPDEDS
jgi:hypothetical protein